MFSYLTNLQMQRQACRHWAASEPHPSGPAHAHVRLMCLWHKFIIFLHICNSDEGVCPPVKSKQTNITRILCCKLETKLRWIKFQEFQRSGMETPGSGPGLWAHVAGLAESWQAGRATTVRMGGVPGPPTAGIELAVRWVLPEPWSNWRFWGGFFGAVCGCRHCSGHKDCWRTLTWSSWRSGTPGRWWPSGEGTDRLDR